MLLMIHCIIILIFILLGVLFLHGKGAFLIAGYNTASKEQKEHTDEQKLCRCVGKLMFALAGCWLVIASSVLFQRMLFLWIGLGLFFVVCIGGVIYMNTGNRFHR